MGLQAGAFFKVRLLACFEYCFSPSGRLQKCSIRMIQFLSLFAGSMVESSKERPAAEDTARNNAIAESNASDNALDNTLRYRFVIKLFQHCKAVGKVFSRRSLA